MQSVLQLPDIARPIVVDKLALPGQSDGLVIVVHDRIAFTIQNPQPFGFHQVMLVQIIGRCAARQFLQRILIVIDLGGGSPPFPPHAPGRKPPGERGTGSS